MHQAEQRAGAKGGQSVPSEHCVERGGARLQARACGGDPRAVGIGGQPQRQRPRADRPGALPAAHQRQHVGRRDHESEACARQPEEFSERAQYDQPFAVLDPRRDAAEVGRRFGKGFIDDQPAFAHRVLPAAQLALRVDPAVGIVGIAQHHHAWARRQVIGRGHLPGIAECVGVTRIAWRPVMTGQAEAAGQDTQAQFAARHGAA